MKIMASSPITSWEIDRETVETVSAFILGGFKITADGDCSHEIKRRLLLGRKVMTNLDQFSSVQFSHSVVSDFCATWIAAHQASPSITNLWSSLRLASIESVMPSSHLILCCPFLLLPSIFPSIRIFSSESAFCIRWPKYWSLRFSISPSNEYSELISFRIDWFDLPASKGLSTVFTNNTVQKHQFFGAQPSL